MILGTYRHFKGGEYKVLYVASHTETHEEFVIYQSVNDDKVWVRPLSMWEEEVEIDGKRVRRFTKID